MSRSLWPRAHGAYAQLLAPLAAALAATTPSASAALLAAGACLAFLAHEPLLVVLGHRGRRLLEAAGGRARWRLGVLAAGAVGTGLAGLALAPSAAVELAALVAVPVAVLILLAYRRSERTMPGETVAAAALSGAAAPVAVASGVSVASALLVWLAWTLGFAATVVAVHRVIARHRRPASRGDHLALAALGAITTAAFVAATRMPLLAVAAPLTALSTVLVFRPPAATRLRAIGVVLTVAALASGGLVIALV
jgi:hypothetical protein